MAIEWELLVHLNVTFPPIILNAGVPLTKVFLANSRPQFGQMQGV